MPFLPSFPDTANVRTIFDYNPAYFEPWVGMTQHLMRGDSALSVPQRELIAAWASKVGNCPYCHGGHAAASTILGYPEDIFDQLSEDIATAAVEDEMRPLLRYVQKIAAEPWKIMQADADAVFAAGWDERALHDAICIASVFAFMNRLTLAHGIQAFPETFMARGQKHVDEGYDDQYQALGG